MSGLDAPERPEPGDGPEALIARGQRLSAEGDYERSLVTLEAAARVDPTNAEAFASIGWALENVDPPQPEGAKLAYASALSLDPRHLRARLGLATMLEWLHEEGAQDAYLAVVRQASADPDPGPETLEVAGWSRHRLGDQLGAAESFRAALAIDPDIPSARLDLGLALLCAGDSSAGLSEYRDVVGRLEGAEPKRRAAVLKAALRDLDLALEEHPELGSMAEAAEARALLVAAIGSATP